MQAEACRGINELKVRRKSVVSKFSSRSSKLGQLMTAPPAARLVGHLHGVSGATLRRCIAQVQLVELLGHLGRIRAKNLHPQQWDCP